MKPLSRFAIFIKNFTSTIKGKIIAITTGTIAIIAIITVGVCFVVFQSLLRQNQIRSVEFGLQLVSSNVAFDMKDITYFARWCGSSSDILNYLNTFRDKPPLAVASRNDKSLRAIALNSSERLKEEFHNTSRYITRVIVSTNSADNFLQVISTSGDTLSYNMDALVESGVFKTLTESPDFVWVGVINDPFFQGFQKMPVIPIARPVHSSFGSDAVGWVYISVSANVILDYLKSFPLPSDSRLYLTIGDGFYEVAAGRILETDPDFTVLARETVKGIAPATAIEKVRMADGRTETLITHSLGQNGWYIHQILSRQQLGQQRQVYLLLIGAIAVAILSLGFFMAISLNRTINQPVARIQKKIHAIAHGDFSRDTSIEWDHELGDIGKGINTLAFDVVNLMDRRIEDEKQKKDLQYQILQSQINPHFLYNTLNSIKWMATIQGSPGIAEMTTALARLLRQVAKGSAAMITLEEELNLVKDYFLIQQYRYGGGITIDYQIVSQELYQCMVHRFSLQPIVENALFHGIEPKGSTGKIVIKAWACAGAEENGPDSENEREQTPDTGSIRKNLCISITDNGVGMSQETIRKVLHQKTSKKSADFFRQVGIANVDQRIRHEFGEKYGISIESQVGQYTAMTIVTPYILKNQES